MDELPVTPNGKVDRTALPAPDGTNTLRDAPTTASSMPTEERLCAIVAPLLNMKQISTDDNFFLLGGSSLMGAQLVALVAESFGVNLSLRTLFERPTVQKLALEIERMIVAQVESMSEADVLRLLQEGV